MGKLQFDSAPSSESITMDLEIGEVERFGENIIVIDTPGFSNSKLEDEEVLNRIKEYSAGLSAIFLVLDVSKFNDNEKFISNLNEMLPLNFEKYLIVIFTHKDRLEHTHPEETLSDVIVDFGNQTKIKQLLLKAGYRYAELRHFKQFATNTQLNDQVENILDMTSKLPKERFHFDLTAKQVLPEIRSSSTSRHFKSGESSVCIDRHVILFVIVLHYFPFVIFYFYIKNVIQHNIQTAKMLPETEMKSQGQKCPNPNPIQTAKILPETDMKSQGQKSPLDKPKSRRRRGRKK